MGKRGRRTIEETDLLNGLVDGTVTARGHTRTIKEGRRTDIFENENDKTIIIYDKNIRPDGNMISMEVIRKKEPTDAPVIEEKFNEPVDNASLPKTRRKYLNEATGKWVSFQRAFNLGLVK